MDVEKTMEFILGQQALFASNMVSLTTRVNQTEEQIQVIARATHVLIETRERDRLAFEATQKAFDAHQKEVQAQMAASNLRHEETTEKLDAMIRIVEDLIRKRNGSSS